MMNVAFSCVLIAGLLPYVCAMAAKWGFQNFDNHNPREWLAQQTGFRARANAAQANSLEAFPFFAVAVILALITGVEPVVVDMLCILFTAARVAYVACYLKDKALFRSLFWAVGLLAVLTLYVLAMMNLQIA